MKLLIASLTLEIGVGDEGRISFFCSIFQKCGSISFSQREYGQKTLLLIAEVTNGLSGPRSGTLVIKLFLRGTYEGGNKRMQKVRF